VDAAARLDAAMQLFERKGNTASARLGQVRLAKGVPV
jgi:hypothetical protein